MNSPSEILNLGAPHSEPLPVENQDAHSQLPQSAPSIPAPDSTEFPLRTRALPNYAPSANLQPAPAHAVTAEAVAAQIAIAQAVMPQTGTARGVAAQSVTGQSMTGQSAAVRSLSTQSAPEQSSTQFGPVQSVTAQSGAPNGSTVQAAIVEPAPSEPAPSQSAPLQPVTSQPVTSQSVTPKPVTPNSVAASTTSGGLLENLTSGPQDLPATPPELAASTTRTTAAPPRAAESIRQPLTVTPPVEKLLALPEPRALPNSAVRPAPPAQVHVAAVTVETTPNNQVGPNALPKSSAPVPNGSSINTNPREILHTEAAAPASSTVSEMFSGTTKTADAAPERAPAAASDREPMSRPVLPAIEFGAPAASATIQVESASSTESSLASPLASSDALTSASIAALHADSAETANAAALPDPATQNYAAAPQGSAPESSSDASPNDTGKNQAGRNSSTDGNRR